MEKFHKGENIMDNYIDCPECGTVVNLSKIDYCPECGFDGGIIR